MRLFAVCLAASLAVACDKGSSSSSPAEPAPSASVAAMVTSAPASSTAAAPAPAAAGLAARFEGAYESVEAQLYLPDTPEMKRVKWRGEESKEGLGKGTLVVQVSADGTVSGTASGPLGELVLNGRAEGDAVAAVLTRKEATDNGFTGTLMAARKDGALTGEMHFTNYNASVLRTASFSLAAK